MAELQHKIVLKMVKNLDAGAALVRLEFTLLTARQIITFNGKQMVLKLKKYVHIKCTRSVKNTVSTCLSCLAKTSLFLCAFSLIIIVLDQINLKVTNSDLGVNFLFHLFC